jgi:TPR repeat protein
VLGIAWSALTVANDSEAFDTYPSSAFSTVEAAGPDEAYELAKRFEQGDAIEEDMAQAVAFYRMAAEAGVGKAQLRMAWLYTMGEGVPEDDAQALAWLRRAAVSGEPLAQYRLAWSYAAGDGVAVDEEQARVWFAAAASQGLADAQNALAYSYHHDVRAPEPLAAAYWYLRAAAQGHILALTNLADLMNAQPRRRVSQGLEVKSVPRGDSEASGWLRPGERVCELSRDGDWIAVLSLDQLKAGWVPQGSL